MMVDLDFAAREAVLERGHQVARVLQRPEARFLHPRHKGVDHVVLVGQIVGLQERHVRSGFGDVIDIVINSAYQTS